MGPLLQGQTHLVLPIHQSSKVQHTQHCPAPEPLKPATALKTQQRICSKYTQIYFFPVSLFPHLADIPTAKCWPSNHYYLIDPLWFCQRQPVIRPMKLADEEVDICTKSYKLDFIHVIIRFQSHSLRHHFKRLSGYLLC